MKLLIVTQTIDSEDPVLGFFHRWVEEFSKHTERIEVICLKEGKRDGLPQNVRVHSLGKEKGPPRFARRLRYAIRFKWLAWRLRHDYDAVFVHMNQEYVLIAGPLWKMLGKPVYMWRNHYAGSWLTDLAAAFCTKVFCTSKHSHTAKYKKTILMPVGVDTERFSPDERVERKPRSILFLGRISPSKRPEMLIDALATLAREGQIFTASIVGSPLPQDEAYYESLKEKARSLSLASSISFLPGVPNYATPNLYRAHEIFVNTSPSGMLDKTIFEAAACGCRVLASSDDFAELAGKDAYFDSNERLVAHLLEALEKPFSPKLDGLVKVHSLKMLAECLIRALCTTKSRLCSCDVTQG